MVFRLLFIKIDFYGNAALTYMQITSFQNKCVAVIIIDEVQ